MFLEFFFSFGNFIDSEKVILGRFFYGNMVVKFFSGLFGWVWCMVEGGWRGGRERRWLEKEGGEVGWGFFGIWKGENGGYVVVVINMS